MINRTRLLVIAFLFVFSGAAFAAEPPVERHYLYVAAPGIRNDMQYGGHGLLVFDIRNKFRPEEVGFFTPPPPEGQKAPMFNDLYVDTDGLIYVTDRIKGGLYILEYTGPKIQ